MTYFQKSSLHQCSGGLKKKLKAKNSVISGIRATATLISEKKIFVCRNCKDILKEFSLYRWDENSQEDKVIKENDHAMDDMRYFVNNVLAPKMLRNIYRKTSYKKSIF